MNVSYRKIAVLFFALSSAFGLSGCSSIAKGVTEAVLEKQDGQEDKRQCEIDGTSFNGVSQSLDNQSPPSAKVTKVLMVHGISDHLPGYSGRFQKKLYEKLGLTVTDKTIKTIHLDAGEIHWKKDEPHILGTLQVTRHTNLDNSKQLLFYELTWSTITAQQKQDLETDSANNDGLVRADLNGTLKRFINTTVPDLLIYNGNGYQKITTAVTQSVCWMLGDDWKGLPENGTHECTAWPRSTFASLAVDDHFFVTHSLGSRITIDTIQNFSDMNKKETPEMRRLGIGRVIRDKEFTVFMMANQLPLLQMGRDAPTVTDDLKSYCDLTGPRTSERVMRKMNVVAFSDPNDILSYPLPHDFSTTKIDSRICPSVTNVSLNVAAEQNLFDAATFANPLAAHSGYMEDDRVVELIANGVHRDDSASSIVGRCKWLEVSGR